ncbi:hypothetical protein [Anaerobranca gottschalkii]|uniref:Uncharacterized protein n=1 Tax=Anaerobranca gottschalkii DSM 13577 TaxID=1120990 RepID=A0A1I0ATD1_9FIRM|nr:hypothetical protein [Anaerobranca gottschalkii]SES97636.1 hypothetical protein SAMN03080614_102631 [Anaerobranca gottschalkii DSM 13577]
MSKFLKDLGLPLILLRLLVSKFHYLILLIVLLRFFFAANFPSTFDKGLLIYILFSFLINTYLENWKEKERKKFLLRARARKEEKDVEKVVNE